MRKTSSQILNSSHFVCWLSYLTVGPGQLRYHVPIYKSFCSRFWDFCWGVVGPWWSVFRLSSLLEKCLPSTHLIFLESFSNKPLDMEFFRSGGSWVCLYKSKCGFRYFDDRFFVWRNVRNTVHLSWIHLNNQRKTIRFIMEMYFLSWTN